MHVNLMSSYFHTAWFLVCSVQLHAPLRCSSNVTVKGTTYSKGAFVVLSCVESEPTLGKVLLCLLNNTSKAAVGVVLCESARNQDLGLFVVKSAFSALTLLVGRQEGHPACKKQWWGTGVVICLERGADLHMAQLMPLPLTVSCSSKIQIGFTFLVPMN